MKKNSKTKSLVSFEDDKQIIETMIIQGEKTQFIVHDKALREQVFEEQVTILGEKLSPLLINNGLIKTKTYLPFDGIEDYENIEEIIDEIKNFIKDYVDCSEVFLLMASYYIVLTYFFHQFEQIPYLRVIGDYGSGKSTLLKTIGYLSSNPIFINGTATASSIFRIIDLIGGTLVFDEADMSFSDTTNEIIKIFNNGYAKGQPVLRVDTESFDVNAFKVFCPKVIGGRKEFIDKATESRCLTEVMRATKREDLKIIDTEYYDITQKIRGKLLKFKFDNNGKLELSNDYNISGLEPRLKQILSPILSIVPESRKTDRDLIIKYMRDKQEELVQDRFNSLDGQIFRAISTYYFPKVVRQKSIKDICTDVLAEDDYKHSKITSKTITGILKQYGFSKLKRNSEGMYIDFNEYKDLIEENFKKFGIQEELKRSDIPF